MRPNVIDFMRCYQDIVVAHPTSHKYRVVVRFTEPDPTIHDRVMARIKQCYPRTEITVASYEQLEPSLEWHSRLWVDFPCDESTTRSVHDRPIKRDAEGNALCKGCRGPIAIRFNKNGAKSKIQRSWCTEECWQTYAFPRLFVWNRDKGICETCAKQCTDDGTTPDGWDLDHRIPVVEGGGNLGPDNWRTLCRAGCHKRASKELAVRLAEQRRIEKSKVKKAKPKRKWPSRRFGS